MATIEPYQTSKGERRYRVRYRTPDRRQTDKRGFRTKRDAEAFAATVEVAKLRGEYVNPTAARATVGDLGPDWLTRKEHLKPSSHSVLVSSWRIHVSPRWARVPIGDVRRTDVQAWVTDLSRIRSATIVARAFGVLAAILDDAVSDRRLAANPARGVKLPRKVPRERNYLTHEQVAALATAAGEQGALILLLAYCGLRWGEAAGLRVQDVDFLRARVNVVVNLVEVQGRLIAGTPKTHERRSVPVPRFVLELLARECEGKGREDSLFTSPRGGFLVRSKSRTGWFGSAVRRASLPAGLRPHDLRHTAASLAVSAGANVKAVQRMLGHASASMTLDVYADLFDDDLDAVATALDEAASRAGVGRLWAAPEAGTA